MGLRGRCLVIEDDPDIAGLLELILTSAGFEVRIEDSGAGGLLAAADMRPDLITLDLGLPDMDGREVARLLRGTSASPILMITAYVTGVDELDGMASGATAYLPKPFRPAQLRQLVDQLCPQEARPHKPTAI